MPVHFTEAENSTWLGQKLDFRKRRNNIEWEVLWTISMSLSP